MSRRRAYAFFAVVAALILFPLGVIGYNELKLATGDEVRLRTEPIDPIDFFRGRYVTLRYDISRLPMDIDTMRLGPGTTVYVPLRNAGAYWTGDHVLTARPSDGRFIQGRLASGGEIRFGIETYFAEESEAKRYEEAATSGQLYVDVVLDDAGKAKIQELHVVSQD